MRSPMGRLRLGCGAAAVLLWAGAAWAQDIQAGAVLVADGFDRFATATEQIGRLPVGERAWGRRVGLRDGAPIDRLVRGIKGALWIGYASGCGPCDCGVYVDGLKTADAVVSVTVGASTMKSRALRAAVSYRAATGQEAAGGWRPGAYHVEVAGDWSGSRDIVLRYGLERLASADVAAVRRPGDKVRLRVAFHGDHHQVWVADRKVIDTWETVGGRRGAGHVGFGVYYSQGAFDDFEVRAVASGPAAPTFDTSQGRIAPLVHQGRPFFVLGTYDAPREADLAEWRGAGGNTAIVSAMDSKLSPEQRRQHLESLTAWAAEHDVALVYYPRFDLYSREGARAIPTRPAEIPAKAAMLREMLAVTAAHPNTLGYWTFDEIENALYKSYRQWKEKKDTGLAAWIAEHMKWTYETLKAGDPDAYVMPTIAWWTTYAGLAPLYDVNVPNTYAMSAKHAPMQAPLYTISYDAVQAADAIRATGRTSFVFMPGIFDVLYKGARSATRRELRYAYFAPLTRGAMGLLPWRLGRCTLAYRRAVVYPTMREVAHLTPWLLGDWCDEQVTSTHDTATADYLRKFPERVRLVPGEDPANKVTVRANAVPDCSHALRRRPDNTYLLLAVNNRKEPIEVTFTLHGLPEAPERAKETIDWRFVPIVDGKIRDTLEPFGVRAFVIEPR